MKKTSAAGSEALRRTHAKPQLPPRPSSNRLLASRLPCQGGATRWQHRAPGSLAWGVAAMRPPSASSTFQWLVCWEMISSWWGLGAGKLETEKITNHHCEIFLFTFLRETRKKNKCFLRCFLFSVKPMS